VTKLGILLRCWVFPGNTSDQTIVEQIVEAAQRKLEALSQYMGKAHTKAACALRSHPAYGRYIRQDEKGMLHIDTAKIASESLPS